MSEERCNFEAGQKVVCVSRKWSIVFGPATGEEVPQFEKIYTVREIGVSEKKAGMVCISLKEFRPDRWFAASGFRPLNDRPKEADTDIGVFTKLLDAKKLEDVQ